MLLINCVTAGMNFVIGGEPGSGKTEFVKFLMQFIPLEKRVITIEDSLEIHYSEINSDADAVELRVVCVRTRCGWYCRRRGRWR